MKKVISFCALVLFSASAFAADSVYTCKAKPALSLGTLEAGEKFQLTIAATSVTIKGDEDMGTCKARSSDKNWGYLVVDNGLRDCGCDGVDFLIPTDMKEGYKASSLVVAANGSFDIYYCTKK